MSLPVDGSQYAPQVGDLIPCGDGTEYEIKDVVRWDTNVFAEGPLPPLPAPTCDWSAFPALTLQPPIVKHYHDEHGDDLFVRNVYEITDAVHAIPNVRYYVDAYDYYHNHVYMYTRYLLMQI